jgi:hypothetical protein
VSGASGRVAAGARGAGRLRRAYRRSPLRHLVRVTLPHRGLREDDVFVASYPRSGNAWLAFILLDLAGRETSFDNLRFELPIVGVHANAPSLVPGGGRLIKTHEPYQSSYRRALHLVRDPRDVALSYYRFMQRDGKFIVRADDDEAATFDAYLDAFIAGRLNPHGTWLSHLESWVAAQRDRPDGILRIRYEDMRADTPAAVHRVAAWLGFEITDVQAVAIAERCSLERMREAERSEDPAVVFGATRPEMVYVGPASLGGWREALTSDQQRRFRRWSEGIVAAGYEAPI